VGSVSLAGRPGRPARRGAAPAGAARRRRRRARARGDASTLNLGITGLLATVTSAGATTKTGNVVAAFPPVTITGSPNNCTPENTQIAPSDFWSPPQSGVYDPGGMLNAAQFTVGSVFNVNALPFRQSFPFDYTESGADASTDHVSGSATLTVTLAP
jgi:hypothetical protein